MTPTSRLLIVIVLPLQAPLPPYPPFPQEATQEQLTSRLLLIVVVLSLQPDGLDGQAAYQALQIATFEHMRT